MFNLSCGYILIQSLKLTSIQLNLAQQIQFWWIWLKWKLSSESTGGTPTTYQLKQQSNFVSLSLFAIS